MQAAGANKKPDASTAEPNAGVLFKPERFDSEGVVTVEGQAIPYHAVAGTIVVHPRGWDDAARREAAPAGGANLGAGGNPEAEASMFYTAYFKKGAPAADRPITFIYNGGPGSSTMWLHMGAWGPKRIVTADTNGAHTPAASLFGGQQQRLFDDGRQRHGVHRRAGRGLFPHRRARQGKALLLGRVDEYGAAFTQFVLAYLSQYGRWNSPKYLFGESYGTPRSAVLVNALETGDNIDFNGVILLSQILNFALSVDGAENNPGSDQAYITALPTYAARRPGRGSWCRTHRRPSKPT